MTKEQKIIAKQKELIKYLFNFVKHGSVGYIIAKSKESELSALEAEPDEEEKYEPYFGWCDVEGCNNEGAAGGVYWNDTGHWTTCSDHCKDARNGLPQPQMKQSAIDRENSRDPETGWLP